MTKTSRFENKFKGVLFGLNPWLPIFAFVTLFQALRVSIIDLIYFGFITLLLIADWKNWIPLSLPERYRPSIKSIWAVAMVCAMALYLVPRQSIVGGTLMLTIFMIVMGLVWYQDQAIKPELTTQMLRTKYAWLVIALFLALWELFAYILSDIEGDISYPTLSVLIAPFLAFDFGRVVFLGIWFSIGVFLLRLEAK